MPPSSEEVFNAALTLAPESRAVLAERLLESLDTTDQHEIDATWAAEAARRLRAFEERKLKAIPGDQVMRSLLAETDS